MNLENITLSERSQAQKITYRMNLFMLNVRSSKSIEIENEVVIDQSWGAEWMGIMTNEYGIYFWDENILKWILVITQLYEYTNYYWSVHFKWINMAFEFYLKLLKCFLGYKLFYFAKYRHISPWQILFKNFIYLFLWQILY